jgi:hypothetical protein
MRARAGQRPLCSGGRVFLKNSEKTSKYGLKSVFCAASEPRRICI